MRLLREGREDGQAPHSSSPQELLELMSGFKDNVTLDHLYRDQLVAMARFLNMNAFAPTALLRFQIRGRLKKLRSEDKEIMWEGVDSLDRAEVGGSRLPILPPPPPLPPPALFSTVRRLSLLATHPEAA